MKKNEKKLTRTSVGGQAVLEGVMMRGKTAMATAVRDPEGKIQIEAERITPPEKRSKFSRAPFIRGVVNFATSLSAGMRTLMRSADVAEAEDVSPSKAEKWLAEKHRIDLSGALNFFAALLGVLLAVVIFIFAPQKLTELTGLSTAGKEGVWFNLVEGGIRLAIFVLYVLFMSLFKSLRRVFMYHGAEHKTISCFEKDLPLTVENVRGCSRVHDRCGTTFLFLVMIVSILVFIPVNIFLVGVTDNAKLNSLIRIGCKLLMLPVVAGVSYEILRALAKTQSKFFLVFKFPGLLLQRITTREPDDGMIEVAIAAFTKVQKMDEDPDEPETIFAVAGKLSELLENTKKRFSRRGIDGEEAEWIFALSLHIPKSAVATTERILRIAQVKDILKIVNERLTGRPLWYIIGDADFYGYKLRVDERVLIPRPETEELAQHVVTMAEDGFKILDLCTGSGAIAIAVKKECEKMGKEVEVTASDISEDALALAKENADDNQAEIKFIKSDLFARIRGRYEIIVSNPPYIPSKDIEELQREVKDHEPRLALDGGEDGLDYYRRIAEDAAKYLSRGGTLMMEVGLGEAERVVKLFKYCDYAMIVKDLAGVDRFVKIVF